MKGLFQTGINHVLRHTRIHMAAAAVVLAAAVYLIVTGHYDNLAARQKAEAVLNGFAIGALLYVVAVWYVNLFLRPHMTEAGERSK